MRPMLTDQQWVRIKKHLPPQNGSCGRPYISDLRTTVEGTLWIARTGAPWRDLSESFGKWISVYQRFRRWTRAGVFDAVFASPAGELDLDVAMVDGTFVKVHQHAAGAPKRGRPPQESQVFQAIGTSRGGCTSKVVALTDRQGRIARFCLGPGNAPEVKALVPLAEAAGLTGGQLIADRAYDSRNERGTLAAMGVDVVIPSTRSRKIPIPHDEQAYKSRHLVENAFADLKQFRGIATRYCKLAATFTALLNLCCFVVNTRETRRQRSPHSP